MTIYLDYNATTPIDKLVFEAMQPFLTNSFGNPSNTYDLGLKARNAVDTGRKQVAQLIHADENEVFFTGCGSEANNTVLKGVAATFENKGKHIISSAIEHPSIQEPLKFLKKIGFDITLVSVNEQGAVNAKEIENAIREDTILVSVMHSNNEVGTLQPIKEIGAICRQRNVLFHSDASQSIGKVKIDVEDLQVDFLTIAGHKLYAPKGIGALYIRKDIFIEPLIHGASQESNQRAGTENVPYVTGLGKAAELASGFLQHNTLFSLKSYFYQQLTNAFGDKIALNGDFHNSLPNTLNISFIGKSGAEILSRTPELCASTGSACHSGSKTVSPVLKAMGTDEDVAYGAIRFSIGQYTTQDELDRAVKCLKRLIE
ncbi:cysteine desulfurase NifS [Pelobium manganitolerans]|uniref:cysteine desulfurase n=1 Tax=Pelobium manganitolerans TaxID=1842495 RepID=A0A419S886_9SPHI|nr:cysteine desulfurase family protein [Pelobium manganitolerans]RKD17638.1 cysteine desulfurase NifS [Pelobium manganitolerans]